MIFHIVLSVNPPFGIGLWGGGAPFLTNPRCGWIPMDGTSMDIHKAGILEHGYNPLKYPFPMDPNTV